LQKIRQMEPDTYINNTDVAHNLTKLCQILVFVDGARPLNKMPIDETFNACLQKGNLRHKAIPHRRHNELNQVFVLHHFSRFQCPHNRTFHGHFPILNGLFLGWHRHNLLSATIPRGRLQMEPGTHWFETKVHIDERVGCVRFPARFLRLQKLDVYKRLQTTAYVFKRKTRLFR